MSESAEIVAILAAAKSAAKPMSARQFRALLPGAWDMQSVVSLLRLLVDRGELETVVSEGPNTLYAIPAPAHPASPATIRPVVAPESPRAVSDVIKAGAFDFAPRLLPLIQQTGEWMSVDTIHQRFCPDERRERVATTAANMVARGLLERRGFRKEVEFRAVGVAAAGEGTSAPAPGGMDAQQDTNATDGIVYHLSIAAEQADIALRKRAIASVDLEVRRLAMIAEHLHSEVDTVKRMASRRMEAAPSQQRAAK